MSQTKIKERPILFSAPMVRALANGTKTQTRRTLKCQPPTDVYKISTLVSTTGDRKNEGRQHWITIDGLKIIDDSQPFFASPYGEVGERLWVREAWRSIASNDEFNAARMMENYLEGGYLAAPIPVRYESDFEHVGRWSETTAGRYRHARFMPRWASRTLLEITDVRIERLNDISEVDAQSEGVERVAQVGCLRASGWRDYALQDPRMGGFFHARDSFRSLWKSINGADSWEVNPYVWAITFRRINAQGCDEL